MKKLESLLEYCESVIDVDKYYSNIDRLKKALNYEPIERPIIKFSYPKEGFTPYTMTEIHEDMKKMMYNEIGGSVCHLEGVSGGLPMIRANYGVGILPSYFGLESKIVGGNMPWVTPVSKEEVKRIIDKGIPSSDSGFGKRIKQTYEFYAEVLDKYPKCREVIKFFHPDYQGPFDVAHLIYGTDIYMDMYDEPEFVHELMTLVTDSYIALMKDMKKYLNDECDGFVLHWQTLYKGSVVLRNDTSVNISAEMYNEFVRPYDEKIFKAFGGGSMHFCGRADQWIFDMAKCEGLENFNFGRVAKQDFSMNYLDFLMKEFAPAKKPISDYRVMTGDVPGFDFSKYTTGITYSISVASKSQAEQIYKSI